MSAPLVALFRCMNPKIDRDYFFKVENNKHVPSKLNIGMMISTVSFDTVAWISTLVCGILGAVGVMKINAIGSYSMIGVSCSITAAYITTVICRIIQNRRRQEFKIVE